MEFQNYLPLFVFFGVIILILFGFRSTNEESKKRKGFKIDYGTAPLIGVLILIITFSIGYQVIVNGIVGSDRIQPYAIIILFMSVAYICLCLDLTGFFEYLALKAVKASRNSGVKLFFYFFFLSSILTIFTSNDIVILTVTPIIIYFTKYTKVNPIPYLIGQFFAANIWSITLYIGNPTNIIVAEAYNLTFLEYSAWMVLPTLIAGFTCLTILWVIFRKQIPKTIEPIDINPKSAIKDKFGAIFGITILISCLMMLALSSYLNLSLWVISLSFALVLLFKNIISNIFSKNKAIVKESLKRMPWKILPFVIGMFILVEALVATGWISLLATLFSDICIEPLTSIYFMAIVSALACNLMNNQPMTILFTQILINPNFSVSNEIEFAVMLALIMGSNFGANFTLIGALAGIMWYKILSDKDVQISFKQFAKYGFLTMPLVILCSCAVLYVEVFLWF